MFVSTVANSLGFVLSRAILKVVINRMKGYNIYN